MVPKLIAFLKAPLSSNERGVAASSGQGSALLS